MRIGARSTPLAAGLDTVPPCVYACGSSKVSGIFVCTTLTTHFSI